MQQGTVDVKIPDAYGETYLHWAANDGNAALCRFLLEHGADSKAKAASGLTPLNQAGSSRTLRLLQDQVEDDDGK